MLSILRRWAGFEERVNNRLEDAPTDLPFIAIGYPTAERARAPAGAKSKSRVATRDVDHDVGLETAGIREAAASSGSACMAKRARVDASSVNGKPAFPAALRRSRTRKAGTAFSVLEWRYIYWCGSVVQ